MKTGVQSEAKSISMVKRISICTAFRMNRHIFKSVHCSMERAELEVKLLGEKMDHLLVHQNNRLPEIEEVQIDYLEDLMREVKKK